MTSAASTTSKPDQFDIGAVLSAPMKDPAWLTKCLVMGLLSMIPILGSFNLMGWTKAVAERRAAGETELPDANFSYLGRGWRYFVSWLPVMAVLMGVIFTMSVGVGVAVATAEANGGHSKDLEGIFIAVFVAFYAGILGFSGVAAIVGPAVNFLHIIDGERFSSIAFKKIWEVMKEGGTQYLLLFVAVLLSGVVAQLGIFAFFVGIFITMPYAQAMQGAAMAEFARVLRPTRAGFPVDGSVGGTSGSPFGVKI